MSEIFHIAGLCHDNHSHLDVADVLRYVYAGNMYQMIWYIENFLLSLRDDIKRLWSFL